MSTVPSPRTPSCPPWCPQAGHHEPDDSAGARVHTARVGQWLSVTQVDHPGGRAAAAIFIDDVELAAAQVLEFTVDLTVAAGLIKDVA